VVDHENSTRYCLSCLNSFPVLAKPIQESLGCCQTYTTLPSWHKTLRDYLLLFRLEFDRKQPRTGTRTPSILRRKFCYSPIQELSEWICMLCSWWPNSLVLLQTAYHDIVIYGGRIYRTGYSCPKCAINEQSPFGTWLSWKRPNTLPNLWRQYQRFECC
jgi:hypothetical protein